MYSFYDVMYEITDSIVFSLPKTCGDGNVIWIVCGFAVLILAYFVSVKRK